MNGTCVFQSSGSLQCIVPGNALFHPRVPQFVGPSDADEPPILMDSENVTENHRSLTHGRIRALRLYGTLGFVRDGLGANSQLAKLVALTLRLVTRKVAWNSPYQNAGPRVLSPQPQSCIGPEVGTPVNDLRRKPTRDH